MVKEKGDWASYQGESGREKCFSGSWRQNPGQPEDEERVGGDRVCVDTGKPAALCSPSKHRAPPSGSALMSPLSDFDLLVSLL